MSSFLDQTLIRRRILMGGALVATLTIGVVVGILFTSYQAQAQQTVTYDGPTAMVFHFVKPSATGDYEAMLQRLQEGVSANHQNMANGWKVFRSATDFSGQGAAVYVWMMDPVMSGADYSAMNIINEVVTDPAEMQGIFESYNASYVDGQLKQLPLNLTEVIAF